MKKSGLLKLPAMKATKEMYEKAWLEEEYDRYQRPSVTGRNTENSTEPEKHKEYWKSMYFTTGT